jgi:hypothetical protein
VTDFFSYLFAILVVTPLQAELSERLEAMPSRELVQAGQACITEESPRLLQRAQNDWGWALANAIGVGVGFVDPVSLLPATNRNCVVVVEALRR